ncbi:Wzz/FepE/Etk N-terminal domain-containing protein [Pedobacter cryophilus]|uniref:Lipopolysaccharide biosynthesis protein n=1 Tax=Pedobacter cryophilus TaxID=2571271 RepID=A0A4U1C546_9SPHI|nr:Wzz/FepE/Etk N-terminal domain-containing protein [Pedobacter cryophilus]TKC00452.1 lipopolysaccharide biosynthesis protein [Pedobacter cryophilus]
MTQENTNFPSDENISLRELIIIFKKWYLLLLNKWKTILLVSFLGGLLGLILAIIIKPTYTAETTFVLEEGDKTSLGQYSGLASMVGLDLGGGSGGVFQGDNILELYKSRTMIKQTLLTKDTFNNKLQFLIDRYIQFNNLREKWRNQKELSEITFDTNFSNYTRLQDSVIGKITETINKSSLMVSKPDKKLSIINVKFKSKDELFAKSFTMKIVSNVNKFYVQTKTKKSSENLAILQHQADSIKSALNFSISGVALATDANPNTNPAFQTLRVPSQRKQVEVQANLAAYQEILKNLEIAKITFRKETPLIQVIDDPTLPLDKEKFGKIIMSAIFSLFFVITYSVILLSRHIIRNTL